MNLGVFLLGGLFGLFLKLLMPKNRSKDNRIIISVSLLFAFCGICTMVDVSPLLGCMFMDTVYINLTDDGKLFKQPCILGKYTGAFWSCALAKKPKPVRNYLGLRTASTTSGYSCQVWLVNAF